MKQTSVVFILVLFCWSGCQSHRKPYAVEIRQTDSLKLVLSKAFDQYNRVDTLQIKELYKKLIKTEKYAGLAFDFVAIDKLKKEIKHAMSTDRMVRSQTTKTLALLDLLKQSLRHNEYNETTFYTYMEKAKNQVKVLNLTMTQNTAIFQHYINNTDSIISKRP